MEESVVKSILELKGKRNARILAHYYQRPEIQEIADDVGDSFYLSKVAKDCKEETIVFCGVRFMAESAKILSPEKRVLIPNHDAGCPMADMATAEAVLNLKERYPKAKVVTYINSSTEVKAVSDVCCTSSNAMDIIKGIDEDEIIFVPDRNLGSYVQEKFPDKKIILWDGFCITHEKINKEEVQRAKELHPGIKVLVHPECNREVRNAADFIGSTGEIIRYATGNDNEEYLIVTEEGVIHELQKRNPDKKFYIPGGSMVCPNMKKTRLEDVYNSLANLTYEISIDEEIRKKAHGALMNMHLLGR